MCIKQDDSLSGEMPKADRYDGGQARQVRRSLVDGEVDFIIVPTRAHTDAIAGIVPVNTPPHNGDGLLTQTTSPNIGTILITRNANRDFSRDDMPTIMNTLRGLGLNEEDTEALRAAVCWFTGRFGTEKREFTRDACGKFRAGMTINGHFVSIGELRSRARQEGRE